MNVIDGCKIKIKQLSQQSRIDSYFLIQVIISNLIKLVHESYFCQKKKALIYMMKLQKTNEWLNLLY
jgi:hypothetical protein